MDLEHVFARMRELPHCRSCESSLEAFFLPQNLRQLCRIDRLCLMKIEVRGMSPALATPAPNLWLRPQSFVQTKTRV
jgi:hypothetical protein